MSYSKYFYVERALQNFSANEEQTLFIVFLAYVAKKNGYDINLTIKNIAENVNVQKFAKAYARNLEETLQNQSLSSFAKVSLEDLKSYLIENIQSINGAKNGFFFQPITLNDLISRFLDIKETDSVVDLGSGTASFLNYVSSNYDCAFLDGIEKNESACFYGNILSSLEDSRANIQQGDIVTYTFGKKYDKICSFPPFGVSISDENALCYFNEKVQGNIKSVSYESIFVLKAIDLLEENGKAVICVSSRFLSAHGEFRELRKYLVENKYLEAIVELPQGALPNTNVKIAMLVLSLGNEKTRFINATSICSKNRRGGSALYSNDVSTIYDLMFEDSSIAKSVSNEMIANEENFSLSSNSYLLEPKIELTGVSEYKKLSDLVTEKITRGIQLKAEELDNLETTAPTDICYVSAKNIQDNRLEKDLLQLTDLDKKYANLILKKDDVLLVMLLTDFLKIAVVEDINEKKIIPASNLYIIRLNKEIIEPLFFKMLLETKTANLLFKSFSTTQTIPAINIDFLNKVLIPVPPMEVQKKLVERYLQAESEQKILKDRIQLLDEEKSKIILSLGEKK